MKVTVNKIDDANVLVSGTIDNSSLEATINKMAAKAGKEIKVDGFRKGKVPAHVVKKLHGDRLAQDAEGEALKELIDAGIKEAGIAATDILGQPSSKKYDKKETGIEVEVEVSTRPVIATEGHMDVLPKFKKPVASEKAIEERLTEIAAQQSPYEKIKRKRAVKDGDMTVIDFEGFVDGVAFVGGKAEKFNLKIGSGQFIPGFEEQLIGMKYEEEKTITVTFPEQYASKDLAGKAAEFKVTLHEIQEQVPAELNDDLAKKLLQGVENATLEMLKERVKTQIESAELSKIYNEDLKPKLVEALVEKFDFALPNNIVEQEIDAKINARAREMSEDELATYKDNAEKIDALRAEVRADAIASVKATFIVDALAKKEEVSVSDQEVSQAIYYEAMMSGQDPQQVIKYYQDNNLLPAVKMGMIEDKLFGKMLGLDA
ncbi:MAG TPA: trigger factor [Sulfurovum sp.]|nr:MAG: trigger factor [Sulfurovum sp. 35-42-20]OYZ25564.1 MAG: trigger factor [Sulfurovum sp. 16-42-52]OYZ49575.1 MAG: trigger factor [Sulfurovum sp. 24-42-9]OZA45552.1 MAG: trigger factor [Sulfurovum sp. 17-42-90]OZA59594.1 MAG: trigger factor [Sulfurovum sp. 39-42-12]HQR74363.1 trigger factor [Sulfurovum sp.]